MSTKIYDAYAVKNMSALELKEFHNDLKELLNKSLQERVENLLIREILSFTDDMAVLDALPDNEEAVTRLKNMYALKYESTLSFQRIMNSLFTNKEKINEEMEPTKERLLRTFGDDQYAYFASALNQGSDIIAYKCEMAKVNDSILTLDYDMHSTLCLYPCDKTKMLMVAFGQVAKILSHLAFSDDKDVISFREKYQLRDYHYQNQTDRPDYVSAREWTNRKKNWDKVIPSGSFAENAINIDLTPDTYDFIFDYKLNRMGVLIKKFPSIEERKAKQTKKLTRMLYSNKNIDSKENLSTSEVLDALREFNQKYDNKDKSVLAIYKEAETIVNNVIQEITVELIMETPVMNFTPNFKNNL